MSRFDFAPHFTEEEFRCPCSCGIMNVSQKFLERLERARIRAEIPFSVVSGSRCKEHNEEVGGVDSSAHLADDERQSRAADIQARGSRQRGKILTALRAVGFNRIGIAKSFIHVDNDPGLPPEVTWLY